ncbi:MAG: peptidylprolyl isomerase [Sphingobacteriia bacterium]|nr:peptidylprolyl isomerase [Sphingobacteriia bacterium]
MRISVYIFFLSLISILMSGCDDASKKEEKSKTGDDMEEILVEVNKQLVKTEAQQIEDLISRYGWEMEETGTGLRYVVLEKGNGAPCEKGKTVVMDYSVKLISGMQIYSSEESGPKSFEIGRGGVEAGLEEAMNFLHVGDKARLIIPSHLARGLSGDGKKIPPKATLIYEIKILDIK